MRLEDMDKGMSMEKDTEDCFHSSSFGKADPDPPERVTLVANEKMFEEMA
ncbi:unnamed protein product [Lepidochelys olivacea]